MDPFGITERVVQFSIDRVSGFVKPSDEERAAAYELLVELSTRTTVAPLPAEEGTLREAMSSVYLVFGETRTLLRKHGTAVAKDRHDGNLSFAVLAVRVLNDVLRPTLSRWHPRLEDYEAKRPPAVSEAEWERRWCDHDACRLELNALRESVRAYIDTLGRIAGTPALADAALPLPASRALGQRAVVAGAAVVRDGDKPRKRMVRWFELRQLALLLKAMATKHAPPAPGGTSVVPLAGARGHDFWFDYVADLGDGFDPTMAVAWQLGRTAIELPPDRMGELPPVPQTLPRGDLLVLGGDTVYPYATATAYQQQLVLPYRLAWEPEGQGEPTPARPAVVAIPGNHDWIGGIKHFDSLFVAGTTFAAHWDTPQEARWFAVQLPRNWWLWGIDTSLDDTLPTAERDYFKAAALQVDPGDRIILCTPVPLWQLRQKKPERYFELRSFFDGLVQARQATMPLFLAGDSHFFAHYRRSDGLADEHHVTAGGGGAFLHPTHNLAEYLPYEAGQPEFRLTRRWPNAADSRRLAPRWRGALSRQFLSLAPIVALLHVAFGGLILARATVGSRPPTPGHGWRDPPTWVLSAWPGWFVLALVIVLMIVTTLPNSDESFLTAGARKWGLIHGLLQAAVLVSVAAVGRRWGPENIWWHFGAVPLIGATISLVVFLAMTAFINTRIKANDNTAFSAAHSGRYKHFLRMRIDDGGRLTVFAVGLDPVGSNWFEAFSSTGSRLVPPNDHDAGAPRIHYIWGADITNHGQEGGADGP